MRILDLQQGSEEWKSWRRTKITASDASSILNMNPWKSKIQVWEEKVFGWEQVFDQKSLDRMARGTAMEPIARMLYQDLYGIELEPMVIESAEYPFLSCSLDGMTETLDHAVEIKCGASSYRLAKDEIVPEYYLSQLAHQMLVTGLPSIDYFCYYELDAILLTVKRDDELIKLLLEKEIEFWHNVQLEIPPED